MFLCGFCNTAFAEEGVGKLDSMKLPALLFANISDGMCNVFSVVFLDGIMSSWLCRWGLINTQHAFETLWDTEACYIQKIVQKDLECFKFEFWDLFVIPYVFLILGLVNCLECLPVILTCGQALPRPIVPLVGWFPFLPPLLIQTSLKVIEGRDIVRLSPCRIFHILSTSRKILGRDC